MTPGAAALEAAALWSLRLREGRADLTELAHWRAQHPENEAAWQQVCRLQQRLDQLQGLPAGSASPLLQRPPQHASLQQAHAPATLSRRRLLQGLGALALLPLAAVLLPYRHDYHSGTGELRQILLPDGSQLTLGSASRVDVDFSPALRRITLHAGELLLDTGRDAGQHRPLQVLSRDGQFVPLGTRFSVRQREHGSELAVLAGSVALLDTAGTLRARAASGTQWLLANGHASPLASSGIEPGSWASGRLVLHGARLDAVIAELSRQQRGWLSCSDEAAALRVSGVYHLNRPAEVMQLLASTLGRPLRRRTDYWLRIE